MSRSANHYFTGAGPSGPANYIEEVFSTYLYTGNGSTQAITNGIDLSTKGGLVWAKSRAAGNHFLYDTARGVNKYLMSNATDSQTTQADSLTAFNSNGFSIGNALFNDNATNYASWTFREQPKFFDVVTYTGNGVASRNISHALGSKPGFVVIKRTDSTGNWFVAAWRGNTFLVGTDALPFALNSTNGYNTQNGAAATTTTFDPNEVTISSNYGVTPSNANINSATYVAYLFAHDAGGFGLTGNDNVISCGSYTGNGSTTGPVINLGYEPQWLMVKRADDVDSWNMVDNMRGLSVGDTSTTAHSPRLRADLSNAEQGSGWVIPTSTGFQIYGVNAANGSYNASGGTYIYIAIRRGPMKVPTTGTSVYKAITYNGVNTAGQVISGAGFSPDLALTKARNGGGGFHFTWMDRLRNGTAYVFSDSTSAEGNTAGYYIRSFDMDGVTYGTAYGDYTNLAYTYVAQFLKRAPSFFDEVCWTGDGTNPRSISHNLTVAPTLIITKKRNSTSNWITGFDFASTTYKYFYINDTVSAPSETYSGTPVYGGNPTASVFIVGNQGNINQSGDTYVSYLFATCAGVSKVGTYTGTATTKQIDCGFTAGARFVLIKRTDSTGDWYVWDSARGIVAGNDPYLLLNSTAAEVTNTDYIDSYSPGFELSSTAPAAINSNGGTFIFLAIA
jgi:hypothetical protein